MLNVAKEVDNTNTDEEEKEILGRYNVLVDWRYGAPLVTKESCENENPS